MDSWSLSGIASTSKNEKGAPAARGIADTYRRSSSVSYDNKIGYFRHFNDPIDLDIDTPTAIIQNRGMKGSEIDQEVTGSPQANSPESLLCTPRIERRRSTERHGSNASCSGGGFYSPITGWEVGDRSTSPLAMKADINQSPEIGFGLWSKVVTTAKQGVSPAIPTIPLPKFRSNISSGDGLGTPNFGGSKGTELDTPKEGELAPGDVNRTPLIDRPATRRTLSHSELMQLAQSHFNRDIRDESLFSLGRAIDFGSIDPYRPDTVREFRDLLEQSPVKRFSGKPWRRDTERRIGRSIGLKAPTVNWAGSRGLNRQSSQDDDSSLHFDELQETLSNESARNEVSVSKQLRIMSLLSAHDHINPPTPDQMDIIEHERMKWNKELPNSASENETFEYETERIRVLLWTGLGSMEVQPYIRVGAWQRCIGYHPKDAAHASETSFLLRKRLEYWDRVECQYRNILDKYEELTAASQALNMELPLGGYSNGTNKDDIGSENWQLQQLRQIRLDVRRTSLEGFEYVNRPFTQSIMERVLWVWSVEHPTCGYVQGQNDLLSIFLTVFLSAICPHLLLFKGKAPEMMDLSLINACEADVYWAFDSVISALRDNFDPGLKGVLRMVRQLGDLTSRIDPALNEHLEDQGVTFIQFGVRWMINLLARELPMGCILRLWDTYMAEGPSNVAKFHIFVCAIFLAHWSSQLKEMKDFQELILFLQDLPTELWTLVEMEPLLSEAYVLHNQYGECPMHWDSTAMSYSKNPPEH